MQKFPNDVKKAEITPNFKKVEKTDPISYQPISITPAIANVFEKLMQNQLADYTEGKKILSPPQFGFRKIRSTEDGK